MSDVLPRPVQYKTDCGLEFEHIEGYGFFAKGGKGLNDKDMATAMTHYHSEQYKSHRIHWAMRVGVVAIGFALAPEAWTVVLVAGLWNEWCRWNCGQQGFSSGVVNAIERFAPHNVEASKKRMKEAFEGLKKSYDPKNYQ